MICFGEGGLRSLSLRSLSLRSLSASSLDLAHPGFHLLYRLLGYS